MKLAIAALLNIGDNEYLGFYIYCLGVGMSRFFNFMGKVAEKMLKDHPKAEQSISERIIVESNGTIRANYDNPQVRRDLINEMRKFADFKTEQK